SREALEEGDVIQDDKGLDDGPRATTFKRSATSFGAVVEVPGSRVDESPSGGIVYENMFNIAIAVSVLGGMVVGLVTRYTSSKPWTPRQVMYLKFPGELLSRMLREALLPLMTSSVISAMGSLDTRIAVRVGLRALFYSLITKLTALATALFLALLTKPGHSIELAAIRSRRKLPGPVRNA
ncbi:unnamed protein product, partial [Ixodes hexagonus]